MKKIAIPSRDNSVDEHFGHCEYYTIVTVDDNNKIIERKEMPSPEGCGCKSNIAEVLKNIGVSTMLAGGMGAGAQNVLMNNGIQVHGGFSGNVDQVLTSWLSGENVGQEPACSSHSHDDGHDCGHHN